MQDVVAIRFPSRTEERLLHERLCAEDPLAPRDVCEALTAPLIASVRRSVFDDDDAHDATIETIMGYLDDPGSYDPSRGRLSTFLLKIARERGIDLLRSRVKRKNREDRYGQELKLVVNATADAGVWQRELDEFVIAALPNERDRKALAFVLDGERATDIFAAVWGLEHLATSERRAAVKKNKDRILAAVRRQRGGK